MYVLKPVAMRGQSHALLEERAGVGRGREASVTLLNVHKKALTISPFIPSHRISLTSSPLSTSRVQRQVTFICTISKAPRITPHRRLEYNRPLYCGGSSTNSDFFLTREKKGECKREGGGGGGEERARGIQSQRQIMRQVKSEAWRYP